MNLAQDRQFEGEQNRDAPRTNDGKRPKCDIILPKS